MDDSMEKSIVVVAEHAAGRIKPATYELLAFAAKIKEARPLPITVVILGEEVVDLAREIADNCGYDVTAVQIPGMAYYNGEATIQALTALLATMRPAFVCIAQTSQGMDYAPVLAVKLNAACITGIEDCLEVEGHLCFARPLYGGKVYAHIRPMSARSILTVQPGTFRAGSTKSKGSGSVAVKTMPSWVPRSRSLGLKPSTADTAAITDAEVIVAAGQGIGDKDNLDLIRDLAALFAKSAVAGSRIVCDRGWLEYPCQVGVTGATVAPRLYIACGISGAVQHVSGMRGSEFIVAINKDPNAAIFQTADVCIVEDLATFIPIFIELHSRKSVC
jgi:electron transfer flavoprotein alpha subunit